MARPLLLPQNTSLCHVNAALQSDGCPPRRNAACSPRKEEGRPRERAALRLERGEEHRNRLRRRVLSRLSRPRRTGGLARGSSRDPREAPLYRARMPRTGKPFSVRMSNCGPLGWVSDEAGYRYQPTHPETGRPWPPMPARLVEAWRLLAPDAPPPEACLINFYDAEAKMGLHQDRDEQELSAPVLSLSLGDSALFRLGGSKRSDPTRSFWLQSGDAHHPWRPGSARLPRSRPNRRRRRRPLLPRAGGST